MNKNMCNHCNFEIKFKEGNIPANQKLLNKYNNVVELMYDNIDNYDGKVSVIGDLDELRNINLNTISRSDFYHLATLLLYLLNIVMEEFLLMIVIKLLFQMVILKRV